MNPSNLHSWIKNINLFKPVFISFGILLLFSSVSYAGKCPNPSPMDSKIFRDFKNVILAEYPKKEDSLPLDYSYRLGHALGRLALAVQNQPDRKTAFDCVQMALEQENSLFPGPVSASRIRYKHRLMMQTAMGMHDDFIAKVLGVNSAEPLYDLFGGKIETPPSSSGPVLAKKPAGKTITTITKKDPAVVGGGIAAKDPTKIEASEGRCSNWMVLNLKDKDGLNRKAETTAVCTSLKDSGDFKTEYEPKSKTCFICNISDWTPILKGPVGATASKVGGGTSGASGVVHPCKDKTIPVSAHWMFYSRGYGGGGAKYAEKAGFVCLLNGYHTYSGSKWRTFSCDKGWVNCRLKKEYPIREVEMKDKATVYRYGKTGWGAPSAVRTPANLVKRGK